MAGGVATTAPISGNNSDNMASTTATTATTATPATSAISDTLQRQQQRLDKSISPIIFTHRKMCIS
ncbi:hypothetical protein M5D96_011187, partial [Drosophila gunungcola]